MRVENKDTRASAFVFSVFTVNLKDIEVVVRKCSVKKVLMNFAKFTGKQLYLRLCLLKCVSSIGVFL